MVGQDITFPMQALPAICSQIDQGKIPAGAATSMYGRIDWALAELRSMRAAWSAGGNFTVFHGSRNGFGMNATFAISRHRYVGRDDKWMTEELDLRSRESHAITYDGSGEEAIFDNVALLKVKLGSVSRVNFAGLCAALREKADPLSGGAPQLLGLGSVGASRHYGLVTPSGTFFKGLHILPTSAPDGTQWRDTNLEPVNHHGESTRSRRRKVLRRRK